MGAKGFEEIKEKPIRTKALMRTKTAQSTPDFQFSNERGQPCRFVCVVGVDPKF